MISRFWFCRSFASISIAPALSPIVKEYLAVKQLHPNAFVLYQIGDFYEIFGTDAIKFSAIADVQLCNSLSKGTEKRKKIPMTGVPVRSVEIYMERLLKKGHSVAIYDQYIAAEGVPKIRRRISRLITPGTVVEQELLSGVSRPRWLMAVCNVRGSEGEIIGIEASWADISTGAVYWSNCCKSVGDFVRLLGVVSPAEVVFDGESVGKEDEIVQKVKVPYSFVVVGEEVARGGSSLFICSDAKAKEEDALEENASALKESAYHSTNANPALRILSGHLWGQSICTAPVFHAPVHFDSASKMLLDSSLPLALEMFKSPRRSEEGSSDAGTLFGCLDKCCTSAGSRLLAERLMQPSRVKQEIEFRLDLVEAFASKAGEVDALEEMKRNLASFPDVERSLQRVLLGKCAGIIQDMQRISRALSCAVRIQALLRENAKNLKKFHHVFDYLEGKFADFSPLLQTLQAAIVVEEQLSSRLEEGNFIRKSFDAELDALKVANEKTLQRLKVLELEYRKRSQNFSLKIVVEKKTLGWFVECSSPIPSTLENEFKLESSSARTMRYRTAALDEMFREHSSTAERIIARELEVFQGIRQLVASYGPKIKTLASAIAEIDLSLAISQIPTLVRPTFVGAQEPMLIKGAFHPVVAESQTRQFKNFVTNNVKLDPADFCLITGPNMGGKSTFLRQTAIISIMAQAGLFVPASEAQLRIFDNVFCRIGSADDISRDQSTFMVEMQEVAHIFQRASSSSLILLDEVGRGTSYSDGLALTIAICKHLMQAIRGTVLFATHYHELDLHLPAEPQVKRLKSAAFVDAEGNFVFSYKILPGSSKESFGIEVAGLAGIPTAVLEQARLNKEQLK